MSKTTTKESLAEKTRVYIDAHPSIKDCVSKGLINYSSLARIIMKDLELDNEEAVMIACRRYASKLGITTSPPGPIYLMITPFSIKKSMVTPYIRGKGCADRPGGSRRTRSISRGSWGWWRRRRHARARA